MNLSIRLEEPGDYERVEYITREAFWDVYKPGCDEHYLVFCMRNSPDFVSQLDFVACDGERVVGHIMYSRAKVIGEREHEVLCVGPVTVDPQCQKKGVGLLLMHHSLGKARKMGFKGVLLFGIPGYYPRFGFVNAERFGITTRDGTNFEAFMALELSEGSLRGVTGRFHESSVFNLEPFQVEVFDRRFPHREKHVLPGQLH